MREHNPSFLRKKYKNVVFVYVSDDMEWGEARLLTRTRRTQDLYMAGTLARNNSLR